MLFICLNGFSVVGIVSKVLFGVVGRILKRVRDVQ